MADQLDYNVIPYELQTGMEEARKIVDQACKQRSLGIFIGPEGGFEPEEVERAMTRNIHPMTLENVFYVPKQQEWRYYPF